MTLEADYGEICRYLGYRRDTPPDSDMEQTIRACARRLEQAVTPRWVSREFPLTHLPDGALELGEVRVESKSLSRNLKGCERVMFFAATLGVEADRLIARATAVRMSEAVIFQAAAASLIEVCCDNACEELRLEAEKEGWYLRPRFSPGYGGLLHRPPAGYHHSAPDPGQNRPDGDGTDAAGPHEVGHCGDRHVPPGGALPPAGL